MAFVIHQNYTVSELNRVDPQYNSTQLKAIDQEGKFSWNNT